MAAAILILTFLQLLTSLIEATYAFGLLQTDIPVEVVSVLFLFTPLLLLIFPVKPQRRLLVGLGWLVLFSRAASVLLDTRGKMMLSGLGVGAFLLLLPLLLRYPGLSSRKNEIIRTAALVAAAAVLASMLLHALYSGNDLSEYGVGRVIPWLLAILGAFLLQRSLPLSPTDESVEPTAQNTGFGRMAALCLGIAGGLTLLYFAFATPGVISRWTGGNYLLVIGLAAFSTAVFIALWTGSAGFRAVLRKPFVTGWNLVFFISLTGVIFLNQVTFPTESAGFPFLEPQTSLMATIALLILLLSFPVIFLDLGLLSGELTSRKNSLRALGGAALLASLAMLILILFHVFTTVYDYIPVIGPFLRDRFWLVYALAGLALILPVIFSPALLPVSAKDVLPNRRAAYASLAAAAVILAGGALFGSRPGPAPELSSLRILTYNIQQGYNDFGVKDFQGQLDLIRSANPDILGLQESDTARVAGGNSDVVRFMADRLDMYAYYGPKTVTGTFGIALLSRYPIRNPRTFFMYSSGEQTAAIEADIDAGGNTYHILVTHLGNGGPIIQQEQVLQMLAGKQKVIAMGDFNFRPGGDQYSLTTAILADAWLAAEGQETIPAGLVIDRRIDHIFVSPELKLVAARYLGPGPSDHPAAMAEVGW